MTTLPIRTACTTSPGKRGLTHATPRGLIGTENAKMTVNMPKYTTDPKTYGFIEVFVEVSNDAPPSTPSARFRNANLCYAQHPHPSYHSTSHLRQS